MDPNAYEFQLMSAKVRVTLKPWICKSIYFIYVWMSHVSFLISSAPWASRTVYGGGTVEQKGKVKRGESKREGQGQGTRIYAKYQMPMADGRWNKGLVVRAVRRLNWFVYVVLVDAMEGSMRGEGNERGAEARYIGHGMVGRAEPGASCWRWGEAKA